MSAPKRLLLDAALAIALLTAANPALTGISVHEWLSLAVVTPLLAHLVLNWEWTARMTRVFFDRALDMPRLNLLVDSVLFVSTVAVMLSGFMVSHVIAGLLGLPTTPSALWSAVHSVSADSTVLLLLAHFALHWRWIVRVASRWLAAETPAPVAPQRIAD